MNLRKTIFATATTAIAALAITTGAAVSDEVTLRGVSCFPIGSPPSRAYEKYVKEVNERGKGIVQIDNIGGAPAIGSPFTLTQKMSRGAYDIAGCPETYFGNVVPEVPVLRLTAKTTAQLRENGGLDYLQKLFHAKNLHYVARNASFGKFFLWSNKKLEEPDLTGLNLRVAANYTAFFKSLGATVQTSSLPQIYTLMENNTVQGFGWPAAAFVPPWAKVTKYQVKPGFYNAPLHLLANLKSWEALNDEQRKLLNTIGLEFEVSSEIGNPTLAGILEAGEKSRAEAGMEIIEFTGEKRDAWLKAADNAGWNEVLDGGSEHAEALVKLFRN